MPETSKIRTNPSDTTNVSDRARSWARLAHVNGTTPFGVERSCAYVATTVGSGCVAAGGASARAARATAVTARARASARM